MESTAYLIGTLNVANSPPSVESVGIYSVDARNMTQATGSHRLVDIFSLSADCFHDAHVDLQHFILGFKGLHWVVPLMGEDERYVHGPSKAHDATDPAFYLLTLSDGDDRRQVPLEAQTLEAAERECPDPDSEGVRRATFEIVDPDGETVSEWDGAEWVRARPKRAARARDWLDEVLDAGAACPVGRFAVVLRDSRGASRQHKHYGSRLAAHQQATRIGNASGEACLVGYVVERTENELALWGAPHVLIRDRALIQASRAQS